MPRPEPENVKRVTCVGAGTIGGGWAAYFLSRGNGTLLLLIPVTGPKKCCYESSPVHGQNLKV